MGEAEIEENGNKNREPNSAIEDSLQVIGFGHFPPLPKFGKKCEF